MRAQLPAGQSVWPAFWLLPADGSAPPEIDIMEVIGDEPTKLWTTVHSNHTGERTTSTNQGDDVADTSVGFHTYSVNWTAEAITWYFDGDVHGNTATTEMTIVLMGLHNLTEGDFLI